MKKNKLGNWVIAGIVLLNIILWLLFPPEAGATPYALQFSGEILASSSMILMAIAIILSTKPRFLEPYFGGLDKMYQTHKQVAILSFLLLIAHFFVIPDSGELGAGKPIGMLSFVGIIFMVLLSIAPRVPLISRFINLSYDKWRIGHKLLGLFFIMGLIHYTMVDTISKQTVPGMYMMLFVLIGILAWLYKIFVFGRVRKHVDYTVEGVNQLNGTTVEVCLKPVQKKVDFNAGQFLFINFDGDRTMKEPHPFTISSSPDEENLRLSVKASGDWTRYVAQNLEPGTKATLDGSYGMFNYKTGGKNHVWVAGGIGVTPFLSWIRDANGSLDADVDFFYGVRGEADALFWDEFQAVDATDDDFRATIRYSSKDGHFSPTELAELCQGDIVSKDIYLCGPAKMTEGFARQFKKMGVPSSQVHYEEFNFR